MAQYLNPEGELTEEELNQIVGLGVLPEKQSALDRQMKTAEALRYGAGPEMRGNSRVQTAANPLEFLASGIDRYQGGKELERLRAQQNTMLDDATEARRRYYELASKGGKLPSLRPQRPEINGIAGPIDIEGGQY